MIYFQALKSSRIPKITAQCRADVLLSFLCLRKYYSREHGFQAVQLHTPSFKIMVGIKIRCFVNRLTLAKPAIQPLQKKVERSAQFSFGQSKIRLSDPRLSSTDT